MDLYLNEDLLLLGKREKKIRSNELFAALQCDGRFHFGMSVCVLS